jgi:hypothetical protein
MKRAGGRKKRLGKAEYEYLGRIMKLRPVTYRELMDVTGKPMTAIPSVLVTLGAKQPGLYRVRKGVWKIAGIDDWEVNK